MGEILVISNVVEHRMTWKYLFDEYRHKVYVASDVQELEKMDSPPQSPFFIVIDMEEKSGAGESCAVTSSLRSIYANAIIIAIVGWGQMRSGLIEAGADGCIARPLDATLVLKLINNTSYMPQAPERRNTSDHPYHMGRYA